MNTKDKVGSARWRGKIDSSSLSIELSRSYILRSTFSIKAKFNQELNELEGTWKSWLVFDSELKLIFIQDKPLST